MIDSVAGCPDLCCLTSLDLGCNRLECTDFSALPATLKLLSLEGNAVTTLNGAIYNLCLVQGSSAEVIAAGIGLLFSAGGCCNGTIPTWSASFKSLNLV